MHSHSERIEKENIPYERGEEKELLLEAANEAGEKLRDLCNLTTEDIAHRVDNVKNHIRRTPMQSSLIALAAGFVLGTIFCR